jgi:hypothetical protein
MSECRVCEEDRELRLGVCFDCAEFESLIADGTDMRDNPVKKQIEGSGALNILYAIIQRYRPAWCRREQQ